jgi:enterochelin esterase-like enzyme
MVKRAALPLLIMLLIATMMVNAQDSTDEPEEQETPKGEVTITSFESETLGRDYDYQVYLPVGYEDSELRYPVIYLLHGRGDDYYAWLSAVDILDKLIAEEAIPPMIAVMPDMPSSDAAGYYIDSLYTGPDFAPEPVETAFFDDLIPHIDSTYRTLAQRDGRALGGYSMGGYGAIRYAFAYPDQFAATIVLSPAVYTPLPPSDSSVRLFGSFGNGDELFDAERYEQLNYPALMDGFVATELAMDVFIAVGDDEWPNPIPEDQMHDLDMEAHLFYNFVRRVPRVLSELRVYDGGHDWDVWRRGFEEGLRIVSRSLATPTD